jgi:hypothetical protein
MLATQGKSVTLHWLTMTSKQHTHLHNRD